MSGVRLLFLVSRYPHPTALARQGRGMPLFPGLRSLEACGLVTRRGGLYRLTRRGGDELAMAVALARLVARPLN